jgi:GNAT superfamily N-acetyltransferase
MEIRPATRKDLKDIVRMAAALTEHERAFEPRYASPARLRKAHAQFHASTMRKKNWKYYVAQEGGRVVGYALGELRKAWKVYAFKKRGYIQDVYVDKPFRLKGAASRLIAALSAWFRSRGAAWASLQCYPRNANALRLYRKLGFKNTDLVFEKKL